MREWVHEAQEVVVVDSFSKDGTLELAKSGLRHPNLRILQHPPGLYQSWNHGIQHIKAEYCYISTVGDSITLAGLRHLAQVIETHRCDVVVSKPDFIDVQGQPIRPSRWPVDDLVHSLRLAQPAVLKGAGLFLFTLVNYRRSDPRQLGQQSLSPPLSAGPPVSGGLRDRRRWRLGFDELPQNCPGGHPAGLLHHSRAP